MRNILQPFTIHEADYALFLADEGRGTAGDAFLGGCVQDLTLTMRFAGKRIEPHGEPFGRTRHIDEEHELEIGTLWAMHGSLQQMPRLIRNQIYVLVIRFQDLETNAWARMTFRGVQQQQRSISGSSETMLQNLQLTAADVVEEEGIGAAPALVPGEYAALRWVNGADIIDLYTYDATLRGFVAIDAGRLSGRAQIVNDNSKWELRIFGVPVLRVTAGGMFAHRFLATGGTFPSTSGARVEFRSGVRRLASVSEEGELSVPNISSADAAADGDYELLVNGAWRGSIGRIRAAAPQFSDSLS